MVNQVPSHGGYHRIACICLRKINAYIYIYVLFPLWVVKGIYHYWKCVYFSIFSTAARRSSCANSRGRKAKWKIAIGCPPGRQHSERRFHGAAWQVFWFQVADLISSTDSQQKIWGLTMKRSWGRAFKHFCSLYVDLDVHVIFMRRGHVFFLFWGGRLLNVQILRGLLPAAG